MEKPNLAIAATLATLHARGINAEFLPSRPRPQRTVVKQDSEEAAKAISAAEAKRRRRMERNKKNGEPK